MKNKNLRYFIWLMTFALIGLIGLQFYWVTMALELNQEQFRQNVHLALNEVARKLEQKEILYLANQYNSASNPDSILQINLGLDSTDNQENTLSINAENYGSLHWKKPDSSPAELDSFIQNIKNLKVFKSQIPNQVGDEQYFVQLNGDSVILKKDNLISSKKDASTWAESKSRPKFDLKTNRPINVSPKELIRLNSKKDLISFVINQWQNRQTNLQDRLNQHLLDSLLFLEIREKGILIPYQFMVETTNPDFQDSLLSKRADYQLINHIDEKKSIYLFCENPVVQKNIQTAGFQVKLFPSELAHNQPILHVYFPQQQAYILRNMWWMLASSLLFVGLVIYCFVRAVSTILKQKKLSEITHDFINNMTHELKTPISTVALACEALQDPDIKQLPNHQDRYLLVIKEENERLGQQVEKVLQIAQLDKGDFELKINELNIHEIIKHAIRNIAIQIENRQGKITTDLKAKLPVLEADEVHLTNIIHNLLDNANKYSPHTPEIMVKTESTDLGIKIEIADRGQGMSKEHLSKVFDKFYRIPTGNIHNVKGFGLGLSYVRTMVEAHQGNIQVKSEPNKGSIFTILLPYRHFNV